MSSPSSDDINLPPPAQRLPPELLDKIFLISCDISLPTRFHSIADYHAGLVLLPDSTPANQLSIFTISHVCARWREVSLNSPKLWSRITVLGRLEDLNEAKINSYISLTQLHLERSRRQPLDFLIEFSDSFAESQDDEPLQLPENLYKKARDFLPIYKLFFAEAHRWRNVHICVYRELFVYRELSGWPGENPVWPGRFPLLQNFFVHVFGNDHDSVGIVPCLTLLEAPFLEVLVQTGQDVEIYFEDNDISTPFESLRVASFMGCMYESNVHLVGPIADITLCNVRGITSSGDGPESCLARGLHIITPWSNNWALPKIFDYVTLPNVFEISMECRPTDNHVVAALPHVKFTDLLNRSSRESLTHLTFINVITHDQVLLSILDMLPSLSHLAIGDMRSHSEDDQDYMSGLEMLSPLFLHTLSESTDSSSLLAHARMLSLVELHLGFGRFNAGVKVALDSFLDMVQRRGVQAEGDVRLKYVRVKVPTSWNVGFAQARRGSEEIFADIESVSSSTEWRNGFGTWEIAE